MIDFIDQEPTQGAQYDQAGQHEYQVLNIIDFSMICSHEAKISIAHFVLRVIGFFLYIFGK